MILCPASTEHPRGKQCHRLQVAKMSAGDKERTSHLLFVKALATRGCLEAISQQMGYHPQYLDSFLRMQHYLLHMDGPLPFYCRHYIAIMAAARHRCRYLVNLHALQFLRVGGDPQWLRGLEYIPPKLQRLSEINKILAHQPWLIGKEHFEKLLQIREESWSLAELVHAVVLLAHYHALASFAFGCGCEQDFPPDGLLKLTLPGSLCFCEVNNGCSQDVFHHNRKKSMDSCEEVESLQERIHKLKVENEAREAMRTPEREEACNGEISSTTDISCFIEDPSFGYQDFAQLNENQPQIFCVQDYSWADHGFSLVNRLYTDIGFLLDDKFQKVQKLQSCVLAKRQGCDPATFKRSVWNYVHSMFGIRYDDYDYSEVNQLLEQTLKLYIQTVTCTPEKLDQETFTHFWKQFKHSEKVHMNLLILEARLQAELLYALRAITQYMVS
uniref:Sestrin-1-like n=1 Tax=Podarcis muralis TaxID=64176 RepID=A0A670KH01_PODMU|nr:sestrin-1-like isoform X1 [Podarcis muralis]